LGSSEPTSFIDENGQAGVIDENFLLSLSKQTSIEAKDLALLSGNEPSIFNFLQRTYPHRALPELERYYHLLFRYSKWLLEKCRPDVIIFRITPNMPPLHTILYHFARARGIKTIIFCDTWVSKRVVAMNDFVSGVSELKNAIPNRVTVSASELPADLQEYYKTQSQDSKTGEPVYMSHIIQGYNFFGRVAAFFKTLGRVWQLGLFRKMWRTLVGHTVFWFRSRLSKELPRAYQRLASEVDFSEPFVYFPLHLQPEFSTNPLGGYFRDQLLALEILAASLPKGWQIYVKEHPTQWLVGGTRHNPYRPKDYYHQMARFPSVHLIPTTTNSFKLIRHSRAVAVISGTAGWEAVLRGKPSLVFGHPWFQHAPGIFRVADVFSCKEALGKIESGYTPDPQSILGFLGKLDEISFKGCMDLGYRVNPKYFTVPSKEQATGMLKGILQLI